MDLLAAKDLPCINDRCRTCMMEIFTGITAVNIFERNIQNISVAEILHSFTALTFDLNDQLPKVVCHLCYEKLYSFYQFILHIENVDTKFQEELKDKDHSSFESDGIMKKDFNFQEVPVDLNSLRENEGSLSMKEEICEEENGGLENFIKFEVVQEYVCNICYKYFSNNGNYLRHIKKHSSSDVNNRISQAEHPNQESFDYKTGSIETKVNPLEDNINSDNEADENDIKHSLQEKPAQHITETSEKEGIVCEICNRCFRNKNSLSAHMKIHVVKGRVLSCPACGKVFNTAYHLKRHQNEVHKDHDETSTNLAHIKKHSSSDVNKIKHPNQDDSCDYKTGYIEINVNPVEYNINSDNEADENDIKHSLQEKPAQHITETSVKEGIVCEICNRCFRNKNSLSAHMKIHVVKGRVLSCPTCGKVFNTAYHLKRHQNEVHEDHDETSTNLAHIKKHSSSDVNKIKHPNQDDSCDYKTGYIEINVNPVEDNINSDNEADKNDIKHSLQEKPAQHITETSVKEGIVCEICNRYFQNKNSLPAHMRIHVVKGRVLSCPTCGKVFNTAYHLKRHQNEVHKDHDETSTYLAKEDAEHLSPTSIKNMCIICKRRFKSQQSVAAHMKIHGYKERVLACSKCGKVFPREYNLKRHELSHEEKRKYKCGFCSESYLTEEILEQHLKQHGETKICSVCQKTFADMLALNMHVFKLHRRKLYLCSYCGKKFESSRQLHSHQQRHMGIKRFACTLCPKKFISKGELRDHVATHTGERHYKCKQCNAAFKNRSTLDQHTFRHLRIKPYHCDVCPKTFVTKNALKCHNRIHTGEKPHSCDICAQAFGSNYSLVKHRRRHH
ncbi:zinc finger protein 808-like isoform X1 [Aricia agestis]|uniref:zinc finger protein 808-like isoform X1 n=1 Tax=Aricia agestis TaxID=91739 RepID=UPI001C20BF17|nr:zinc finger protein 808-like isoform X1 [Aricia agestis]